MIDRFVAGVLATALVALAVLSRRMGVDGNAAAADGEALLTKTHSVMLYVGVYDIYIHQKGIYMAL